MKTFKTEHRLSNLITSKSRVTEENLVREVVIRAIEEMPIEYVKSLFNIEVIKGTDEEMRHAFENNDDYRYRLIEDLMRSNSFMIRSQITVEL